MLEQQEFIYRISPTRSDMLQSGLTEEEQQIVTSHFHYLEALCKKGTVVLAGRTLTTDEHAFGIVILRTESESKALEIMQNDPAVEQNVMIAELFPYKIALMANQTA